MAEGINIKVLPQTNSILGNDRVLLDRNVSGTLVIPFSAIVVNQDQVSFYSDFVNLSAYTYALSASTNAVFSQIQSDISTVNTKVENVSTNLFGLSSAVSLLGTNLNTVSGNTVLLRSNVNSISANVNTLSSNTTTFISGGISPSGSIIPSKVGILYFAANTKDYFVSVGNVNDQDWKRILTVDY